MRLDFKMIVISSESPSMTKGSKGWSFLGWIGLVAIAIMGVGLVVILCGTFILYCFVRSRNNLHYHHHQRKTTDWSLNFRKLREGWFVLGQFLLFLLFSISSIFVISFFWHLAPERPNVSFRSPVPFRFPNLHHHLIVRVTLGEQLTDEPVNNFPLIPPYSRCLNCHHIIITITDRNSAQEWSLNIVFLSLSLKLSFRFSFQGFNISLELVLKVLPIFISTLQ